MKQQGASNRWTIFGSVGAAVAAAICCLGPLVLVSLGVTGAWIGNLSALEPYRPLFAVVAAGLLGFGFYRVYGRSEQQECGEGAECEVPRANRINQVSLWIAVVVVGGLFASPYFSPYFLSAGADEASAQVAPPKASTGAASAGSAERVELATVVLEVQGMTCGGCASSVQTSLERIDGVEKAEVTFEPPEAHVRYDASRVTVGNLMKATSNVGYPSKPKGEANE